MVRLLSRTETCSGLHPVLTQSTCRGADRSIAVTPDPGFGGTDFPNCLKSAYRFTTQRPSAVAIRGLQRSDLRRPCPPTVNATRSAPAHPTRRRSSIRSARSPTTWRIDKRRADVGRERRNDVLLIRDRAAISSGRAYAQFLETENAQARFDVVVNSDKRDEGRGVAYPDSILHPSRVRFGHQTLGRGYRPLVRRHRRQAGARARPRPRHQRAL